MQSLENMFSTRRNLEMGKPSLILRRIRFGRRRHRSEALGIVAIHQLLCQLWGTIYIYIGPLFVYLPIGSLLERNGLFSEAVIAEHRNLTSYRQTPLYFGTRHGLQTRIHRQAKFLKPRVLGGGLRMGT